MTANDYSMLSLYDLIIISIVVICGWCETWLGPDVRKLVMLGHGAWRMKRDFTYRNLVSSNMEEANSNIFKFNCLFKKEIYMEHQNIFTACT